MVHDVALVLGGGGAAGQAWQIGVIAGLAEAGLDLTEAADLVVGTSSGSTTAAQVRSGIPAAELLASVLSPPVQPAGRNREQPPSLPMATVFERMRAIGAAATSAADLRRAMGAFGLESDSVLEPGAGQRRAMVAARLPRAEWPDRPMIVVARRRAYRRAGGVRPRFRRRPGGRGHREHRATRSDPHAHHQRHSLHQRWRALRRKRRPCLGLCERRGAHAVRRTEPDTTGTGREPGRPVRGPAQIPGRRPGQPGRGPAPAGQPRRGDHTGRRFPGRNGCQPDGPGDPHHRRPCRFRPRQAGSDPRDVPLTMARRLLA